MGDPDAGEDHFLAIEAGRDKRQPGQSGSARQKSHCEARHGAIQPPHAENILLVVEAGDESTRCKEQKRLEKRVGHQMKKGGLPDARAKGEKHIAKLTDGGPRQDTFEICLDKGCAGSHHEGERANNGCQHHHKRGRGKQFM